MQSEDQEQREGRRGRAQLQKGEGKIQVGETSEAPGTFSSKQPLSVSALTLVSSSASQPPSPEVPTSRSALFHLLSGRLVPGLG